MFLRQEDKKIAKLILEVGDGKAETLSSIKVKVRRVITLLWTKISISKEYLNYDTIELEATLDNYWTSHYTQEYINSTEFLGLSTTDYAWR